MSIDRYTNPAAAFGRDLDNLVDTAKAARRHCTVIEAKIGDPEYAQTVLDMQDNIIAILNNFASLQLGILALAPPRKEGTANG
jgi:hypothetical protein